MSEFSFSSSCKNKKIESSLLSHLFNVFFFIFLSSYLLRLLPFFSPLFITTLSFLALFPPNLVHDNDDSESSGFKCGFLLSVVESLVQKVSSKNDENDEGTRYFEAFEAYLDVFGAPIFEVLKGNSSESGYSGDEGRESRAHVGPMEKQPNVNFVENPFEENDDKVEAARPVAEENMFCDKECREVIDENYSESESLGDDEGRGHVGLTEDPNVNLEENPVVGEEDDDVDKVEINTKLEDMFCQKRDKEVKPLDTHSNKAEEESKEKMALRNGSKVMCNDDSIIDAAKDSTANSEEEYFGTPERNWDYSRSYGSMRKEKEWRRTLAFKLYEERNNVDDGNEAMDLLWETYEDTEIDKANASTKSEDNDDDEDEEEGDKEKGMEGKYCCLQALKFSAGKMNLGMRKPSLVKISKALKSIGLLHHVSKHGRKKLH